MTTVSHSHIPTLKNEVDFTCALPSVVQRVQNEILISIQNHSNIIVLTGEAGKGKTTLLRTIGNKISNNNRLIFFTGSDLLSSHSTSKDKQSKNYSSNNSSENDFNFIKDFIFESAILGDELTVIIDGADCLPAEILHELLDTSNQISSADNRTTLILSGLPELKKQLEKVTGVPLEDVVYCSLDELNDNDVRLFSTKKEYLVKPENGALNFDRDSLTSILKYISGDIQRLDVLLEWCSVLSNKNKTNLVTKDIANNAISLIEQSLHENGAAILDAYPTQKDVKRITADKKFTSKAKKAESVVKEADADKDNVKLSPEIPMITTPVRKTATQEQISEKTRLEEELAELEEEVMPTQWVPSSQLPAKNKNSFFKFSTLLPLFALGLIVLVFIQHQSKDSRIDADSGNQSIVQNQNDENLVIEKAEEDEPIVLEGAKEDETIALATVAEDEIPDLEIVSEDKTIEPIDTDTKSLEAVEDETIAMATAAEDEISDLEIVSEDTTIEPIDTDTKSIEAVETEPQLAEIETSSEREIEEDSQVASLSTENAELVLNEESVDASSVPSISTDEVVDSSQNAVEIQELLALATQQFDVKNLTTPLGNNAFETYQSILAKDPNHAAAKKGIQNIHDRYVNWANYYLQENNRERSKYFFEKALEVDPDDQVSNEMIKNLNNEINLASLVPEDKPTIESQIVTESTGTAKNQSESSNASDLLVGELLIKAKQQLQDKNLTSPPNNNAFETYKQVLENEPDNAIALQGISMIKKSYVNWAEQDLKKNNHQRAALFYKKALAIDPTDTQLVQRLEEIKSMKNPQN